MYGLRWGSLFLLLGCLLVGGCNCGEDDPGPARTSPEITVESMLDRLHFNDSKNFKACYSKHLRGKVDDQMSRIKGWIERSDDPFRKIDWNKCTKGVDDLGRETRTYTLTLLTKTKREVDKPLLFVNQDGRWLIHKGWW